MRNIKARVLRFLTWLGKVFLPISSSIEEVFLEREYEQPEPIRAPAYVPQPRLPVEPQSWATHKPKPAQKKPGKVVLLTAEQIKSRSKPGNRKPTRAQRRAAAKSLKDAA